MQSLFESAHRRLAEIAGRAERPPDIEEAQAAPEADRLLLELGYLEVGSRSGEMSMAAGDGAAISNRLALLTLAGRLERIFPLPCRPAPRIVLLGGEVAPRAFGLAAPDQPLVGVSGRGLSLRAAFEGCLGEAAEYLSFLTWGDEAVEEMAPAERFAAGTSPSAGESHLAWMLCGLGLEAEDSARPLGWIAATRFGDGRPLPVPADLCLRGRPDSNARRQAESGGCAAGATLQAAQYRGLMEVVERDAVALWWYGGRAATTLRLDAEWAGRLHRFMSELRAPSGRRHWFLDITTDVMVPAVAALSCDDAGASVIGGFAADLDPLAAAHTAALELCQMETALDLVHLKREQRGAEALNEADRKQLARAQGLRIESYPSLAPGPPPAASRRACPADDGPALAVAVAALARAGFDAYWVELTRAQLGIPVARALVPGLQSSDPRWTSPRLERQAAQVGRNAASFLQMPAII